MDGTMDRWMGKWVEIGRNEMEQVNGVIYGQIYGWIKVWNGMRLDWMDGRTDKWNEIRRNDDKTSE